MVLVTSACVGTKAREEVLVPAMQVSWPQIQALALLGADESGAALVEQFSSALSTGNPSRIVLVPFEAIRLMALEGILIRVGNGTLGPFGAGSYRENVSLFNQAYLTPKGKY